MTKELLSGKGPCATMYDGWKSCSPEPSSTHVTVPPGTGLAVE